MTTTSLPASRQVLIQTCHTAVLLKFLIWSCHSLLKLLLWLPPPLGEGVSEPCQFGPRLHLQPHFSQLVLGLTAPYQNKLTTVIPTCLGLSQLSFLEYLHSGVDHLSQFPSVGHSLVLWNAQLSFPTLWSTCRPRAHLLCQKSQALESDHPGSLLWPLPVKTVCFGQCILTTKTHLPHQWMRIKLQPCKVVLRSNTTMDIKGN